MATRKRNPQYKTYRSAERYNEGDIVQTDGRSWQVVWVKSIIPRMGKYTYTLKSHSEKNPGSANEDWIACHAIRKLPDGSIQLLTEKGVMSNPGRKKKFLAKVRKLFSK